MRWTAPAPGIAMCHIGCRLCAADIRPIRLIYVRNDDLAVGRLGNARGSEG
jgi:hypothetical protein